MHNYLLSDFDPDRQISQTREGNNLTHITTRKHQGGVFYIRTKIVGNGKANRKYSLSLDGKYEAGLNQFIKKHGLKPCV